MFGFFKNKQLHSKVRKIEEGLHYSFNKIKDDFLATHKKLEDHSSSTTKKLDELHLRLSYLEKLFSLHLPNLQAKTEKIEGDDDEEFEKFEDFEEGESKIYQLTDKQQKIFNELVAMQSESGSKWISLKELAEHVYPRKEYKGVRSTISEYTSVLEEQGLIEKKSNRKRSYVRVNKKGLKYTSKERAKKLAKLIA